MKLSDAEWQVMNALWAEYPATAREIIARLPRGVDWAYTTVKTMLTRLVEKGAVKEYKDGVASRYEPLLTRHKARRGALRKLVDQAFDGAFGPLMHFLVDEQHLSPQQRQELIEALQKASRSPKDD